MRLRHRFALLALASALLPASHVSSLDARASNEQSGSLQPVTALATLNLVGHPGGDTTTAFVREGYAYAGVGPELDILNISQPPHAARVASRYAYLISGTTLYVVDVASPAAPRLISHYAAPQDQPRNA